MRGWAELLMNDESRETATHASQVRRRYARRMSNRSW